MLVHVLLYDAGRDSEGIHSLEISGTTVVLLFENPDDAHRYAGLLEAQDFPVPTVEELDRKEMEIFCDQAGYEARLVESGFVPSSNEDRLMLAPPESNRDVSDWRDQQQQPSPDSEFSEPDLQAAESSDADESPESAELKAIRNRLEGLL